DGRGCKKDYEEITKHTRANLHVNNLGRQDIRNLTELLDHVIADRIVDEQKRQGFTAFTLSSQMHSGDVHIEPAENGSDSANDAGLVVVRGENHISVRHDLEGIPIYVHNTRELVREHRSRYSMRFYVGLELDDDKVREIFRGRQTCFQDLDSTQLCHVHGIDQVYPFPQHRRKQATDDDRCEVIEIHIADLTRVVDRNSLHATITNL